MKKPTTEASTKANTKSQTTKSTVKVTDTEATPQAATPVLAAEAYAQILPEIDGLPEELIRSITVDIPRAVSIAMGALPALMAVRADIIGALPDHRIAALDGLKSYALGAWYAHMLALPSTGDATALKKLLDEAAPLRDGLLVAAEALAHRGLLDATTVAEVRSGTGNLDTANDLIALSTLFTMHWEAIESKTAVTRAEVDRAAQLAPELIAVLGGRAQGARPTGTAVSAADRRARAFTLLVNAYDSCRQAVAYLRWNEGDADSIAPSLFKPRAGRRGTPADPSPPDPEPPVPAPSPSPPIAVPATVTAPVATPPMNGPATPRAT